MEESMVPQVPGVLELPNPSNAHESGQGQRKHGHHCLPSLAVAHLHRI